MVVKVPRTCQGTTLKICITAKQPPTMIAATETSCHFAVSLSHRSARDRYQVRCARTRSWR